MASEIISKILGVALYVKFANQHPFKNLSLNVHM